VIQRLLSNPTQFTRSLSQNEIENRLERLMLRDYRVRKPAYKGAEVPEHTFHAADVLELERALRRGEGVA
jgi:hypothetical protein